MLEEWFVNFEWELFDVENNCCSSFKKKLEHILLCHCLCTTQIFVDFLNNSNNICEKRLKEEKLEFCFRICSLKFMNYIISDPSQLWDTTYSTFLKRYD